LTVLTQLGFFIQASIPDIAGHMNNKYGIQWTAYTKKVPYALIPYIY